jgi:hypothetical protein
MAMMLDPVVGLPVPTRPLTYPVTFHPHVVVTPVGPVSRSPDVAMTGRRDFNDSRCWWSDLDVDGGRVGQ